MLINQHRDMTLHKSIIRLKDFPILMSSRKTLLGIIASVPTKFFSSVRSSKIGRLLMISYIVIPKSQTSVFNPKDLFPLDTNVSGGLVFGTAAVQVELLFALVTSTLLAKLKSASTTLFRSLDNNRFLEARSRCMIRFFWR